MNIDIELYDEINQQVRSLPGRQFFEKVQPYLASRDGLRVLDIGCSVGNQAAMMAEYMNTSKVIAVDIDEPAILYARRKYPHIDFIAVDCSLPWPEFSAITKLQERSIDVVTSTYTVHWFITEKQRSDFVHSVSQVLTEDGQAHLHFVADYWSVHELFKDYLAQHQSAIFDSTRHEKMKDFDEQKLFWQQQFKKHNLDILAFNVELKVFHWPIGFMASAFRLYCRKVIEVIEDEDGLTSDFLTYVRKRSDNGIVKGDKYCVNDKDIVVEINEIAMHLLKK
ncbi:hypothetical protein HDE_12749 [Halotydeus destructor]|nr:hypothetical protein HDE_12749 [Halotydeus destructor]